MDDILDELSNRSSPKMTRNPARIASLEPPRVGSSLQQLRQSPRVSLDELSRKAGVSKSMLSQIERNQANPTVAVVWRLANALGVPLSNLIARRGAPRARAITTVAGARNAGSAQPGRQVHVAHPRADRAGRPIRVVRAGRETGRRVAQRRARAGLARAPERARPALLEVTSGETTHRLKAGETARYAVDVAHAIVNPTRSPAQRAAGRAASVS